LKQRAKCSCVVPFKLNVKTIDNSNGEVLGEEPETTDLMKTFAYLKTLGIENQSHT
jgi:hypothetical protein